MAGNLPLKSVHTNEPFLRNGDMRNILGVDVCVASREDALAKIVSTVYQKQHHKIAFLNAHGANIAAESPAFRNMLDHFTVLADGIGLDVGSRILYGMAFPANLNGTDFLPALLAALEKPVTVGLLGAQHGVAEEAAARLSKSYPLHKFTVHGHGYFDKAGEEEILKELEDLKPDILLVALGNPKQEEWILKHCTQNHTSLAIGVGAFFDFVAERVSRAPSFVIKMRCEWVYRLMLEPQRMWKRYVLGNPLFILRVLRQKFSGSPRAQ